MNKNIRALLACCLCGTSLLTFDAAAAEPVEVLVDCTAGEKVNDALAAHADADAVVVTLSGLCDSGASITRNNVTLKGATAADGFKLTTNEAAINTAPFVSGVVVTSMTIDSTGFFGILCGTASGVNVSSVTLTMRSANSAGVFAFGGSRCRVVNSTLTGIGAGATNHALTAAAGAYVELASSTVEGFSFGVYAITNATALIGAPTGQVVIKNNLIGVVLESGGTASITGTSIENSTYEGILVHSNSSISAINRTLSITNNGAEGIDLKRNASAVFKTIALTISGNGLGAVKCDPSVGLLLQSLISPQISGAIDPNCIPVQ